MTDWRRLGLHHCRSVGLNHLRGRPFQVDSPPSLPSPAVSGLSHFGLAFLMTALRTKRHRPSFLPSTTNAVGFVTSRRHTLPGVLSFLGDPLQKSRRRTGSSSRCAYPCAPLSEYPLVALKTTPHGLIQRTPPKLRSLKRARMPSAHYPPSMS